MDDTNTHRQRYLEGWAAGSELARVSGGLGARAAIEGSAAQATPPAPAPPSPDALQWRAQEAVLAAGGTLTPEEQAKREKNPLDLWDDIRGNAAEGRFPKGLDVFRYKYSGLFYVAPSQDAFMCRLRIPNGILTPAQLAGVAELAERFGGGYVHVTTRANLQIREIAARHAPALLEGLCELGLTARGSGADNIRNVTGSPTAGIDPEELIDTRPLAREWHHYILNHRELYGLPRKFNVAFDGGGQVSALADTNDIGFAACRVGEGQAVPAGVYFRLGLGGITGHGDFAQDTGVLLRPDECTPVAAAIVRVFIAHGDRTDRKKARLKYLLERWGLARFLEETERALGHALTRLPAEACEPRVAPRPLAHVGFHPQRQAGRVYLGVVVPVGRLTVAQMRGLAALAQQYEGSTLRLTVWQNLLISDIPEDQVTAVQAVVEGLGLHWAAHSIRAGLVACTGNTGCKFSASDTKRHALAIAEHVEARVVLDSPLNVHLTGCPHSCAQHYIGDIGLLGAKVESGDADGEPLEGYHIYVGGGAGTAAAIGRELYRDVPATEAPQRIERMLRAWLRHRRGADESFCAFTRRLDVAALRTLVNEVEGGERP